MARFRRVHDTSPGWANKENEQRKKEIKGLRGSRRLAASSVGGSGTRGTQNFRDTLGRLIATFGTQADGVTIGARWFRTDGSILADFVGVGPFGAFAALRDKFNNSIVIDDPNGGLARPRLVMGQWVPNAAMGANPIPPTSSTYVTVETAEVVVQSPYVRVTVLVSSSAAGATGNVRVINAAGAVVMGPTTIPSNATTPLTLLPTALPATSSLGLVEQWQLQVNLTGTGTVGARGRSIIGSASYDTA